MNNIKKYDNFIESLLELKKSKGKYNVTGDLTDEPYERLRTVLGPVLYVIDELKDPNYNIEDVINMVKSIDIESITNYLDDLDIVLSRSKTKEFCDELKNKNNK